MVRVIEGIQKILGLISGGRNHLIQNQANHYGSFFIYKPGLHFQGETDFGARRVR